MYRLIFITIFFVGTLFVSAQETESTTNQQGVATNEGKASIRPDNAVTAAIGFTASNGDLPDAKLDLNMQIGYKRYLASGFNLSFTYNKFNVVFGDVLYEGFMSFDLDLEYMFFPEKEFTPYIYVGPGFNAANYFEQTGFKFQLGLGLEYLVSENVGLKLYADRNFLSNDTLDGLEAGSGNDSYIRIGIGANIYFPVNAKKNKDNGPTFMDNNKLDDF